MTNHSHHHHGRDARENRNPYLIPFLLILFFAAIEFFGGIWTQSLALLSDAWHMISDVIAIGIAMFASYHSNKSLTGESKAEFIASVINALSMLVVVAWIIFEALDRMANPKPITGGYVMLIAFIGLIVNLFVAKHLHHHGESSNLNQRAAFLHVMGDILGSVAALVAGAIIYFTGWLLIDPILSIVISILLLSVTMSLIRDIWKVFKGEKTHRDIHHHDH